MPDYKGLLNALYTNRDIYGTAIYQKLQNLKFTTICIKHIDEDIFSDWCRSYNINRILLIDCPIDPLSEQDLENIVFYSEYQFEDEDILGAWEVEYVFSNKDMAMLFKLTFG